MTHTRFPLACVVVTLAALVGWVFMDTPYRLESIGLAADQEVLAHRDSAYSSITLVASPDESYLQLRFFDRVEGGVCLKPSWADLAAMGQTKPTLAHLIPATPPTFSPGQSMWPHPWTPDPGTLSNSAYVRLFPAGVLLNEPLMSAAHGDTQKVAPRIMVIGLGSGIGIATLAHHFPQAAITVVDIDQVVIDLIRTHYPMLNWLATQKCANGDARLRFIARDARQYIRFDAKREASYDLIILDAYTSGSTIPPHLMTREFFAECSEVLRDGGMTLANVIGNVVADTDGQSDKSLVLGGAIRSFRAAGLTHAWCFPILNSGDSTGLVDANRQRNNIIIASKSPLDPRAAAAGWDRLSRFVLVPELEIGKYTTAAYILVKRQPEQSMFSSAALSAKILDLADPNLRHSMRPRSMPADAVQQPVTALCEDHQIVTRAINAFNEYAKKENVRVPLGWDKNNDANAIQFRDTDWVIAERETFRTSVSTARDASKWSGVALTGDVEQGERPPVQEPTWLIPNAPLFTDQRPNADIYNH